jgi:hypothetical protein
MAESLQVPGFGIPLSHMPPADQRFPVLVGAEGWDWKALTLLTHEVCMLKLVEELTNKPEWWIKVHDPQIADRWKQEALQFDWKSYRSHADFTPAMADAVGLQPRHGHNHRSCADKTTPNLVCKRAALQDRLLPTDGPDSYL